MAHGSSVRVEGTVITALPLGLTLLAAVLVWRLGLRLGDSVSGHGPDADAIADGMRDWTVASATGVFTLGYAVVVVVTHHLAATPATAPSLARTLVWTVVLCGVIGGSAIAVGSGRAAIWTSFLPLSLRAAVAAAWRILIGTSRCRRSSSASPSSSTGTARSTSCHSCTRAPARPPS